MALQESIQEILNIDALQFNLLYSAYSLPNIILPFFGWVLIDSKVLEEQLEEQLIAELNRHFDQECEELKNVLDRFNKKYRLI
jgi:hypothetical protein